jgi:hypothetical protein
MTPKKPMMKTTKKVVSKKMVKAPKESVKSSTKYAAAYGSKPTTPPSGTPIYKREPRTASYQDSMTAYNSIKGKAAGAENLKPKGSPKVYVGQTKSKKK